MAKVINNEHRFTIKMGHFQFLKKLTFFNKILNLLLCNVLIDTTTKLPICLWICSLRS